MTRNKPYLILTGGIACSKINLSGALAGAGAVVIDADEISHALTGKTAGSSESAPNLAIRSLTAGS